MANRVLMTGATGYIASQLLPTFQEDYEMVLVDVKVENRDGDRVDGVEIANLIDTDRTKYAALFEGVDAVVHLGWADARLSNFELGDAFGALNLDGGTLDLIVKPSGIDGKGEIRLQDVPMTITWRHDFGSSDSYLSRYTMIATLGPAERRALGFNFATYLDGPTKVELQLAKDRSGGFEIDGVADLSDAQLFLPQLRWRKPAKQSGTASFSFYAKQGEPINVKNFRVETDGFEVLGSARYGAREDRIRFDRIRFAENDFAADVVIAKDGATAIGITGRALDLRPLFDDEISSRPVATPTPAKRTKEPDQTVSSALTLDLKSLIISDRFTINDAHATASREGDRWRQMSGQGALNGGTPVDIKMVADAAKHQKLTVTSQDAGGIFASSGYPTGVTGGAFLLEAKFPEASAGAEPTTGILSVSDFMLVDAPVMTQILTIGSITGIVDLLQGQGISFDRLEAPFEMRGDSIKIKAGRAAGAALGFTMAGTIDRAKEQLDIRGAVVPAYTINSALGRIPLLGRLFVGREGEGVFALRYHVEGAIKNPDVSVNPLSALAPGVLRYLVEVFDEPLTIEPPETEPLVPESSAP